MHLYLILANSFIYIGLLREQYESALPLHHMSCKALIKGVIKSKPQNLPKAVQAQ